MKDIRLALALMVYADSLNAYGSRSFRYERRARLQQRLAEEGAKP